MPKMAGIKRWLAVTLSIAALCLGGAPAGAGQEPIVVGAVLPMTGPVAAYGQMCWLGAQIAHKMQTTVGGRPVKLGVGRQQERQRGGGQRGQPPAQA